MTLKSVTDHVDDLRKTIFWVVSIIAIGFILSFTFADQLIHLLTEPFQKQLIARPITLVEIRNPSNEPLLYQGHIIAPHETKRVEHISNHSFHLFSPAEGFFVALKISLWAAFILTAPFWLIPVFLFIAPALHPQERRALVPGIMLLASFLLLGLFAAYKVTIPLTNQYFWDFNNHLGINLWGLSNYIDNAISLMIAHAIGFEGIAILLLLIHFNFIDVDFLKSKRRHAIVISLILGALLTPPDVLSQLLVALPLYLGYELTLFYGSLRKRRACATESTLNF